MQAQVRAAHAQPSGAETALHDISLVAQFDAELVKKRIGLLLHTLVHLETILPLAIVALKKAVPQYGQP